MPHDTDRHSVGDPQSELPSGIEHDALEELYTELNAPESDSALEGKFDRQSVLLRALRLLSTEDLAKDLDSLGAATVPGSDGTPVSKLSRILDRLRTEYRSWLIALIVPKIRYPRTAAHLHHACLQLLANPAHPERQHLEGIVELVVHRTVARGPDVFEASLDELRRLRPNDPLFEERSQFLRERISTMTRPLVLAHRGTPMGEFPENTLEGFQQALDDGADGFEMDVCVTKDGRIVLWHDAKPTWNAIAYVRQLGLETGMTYRPLVPKIFSRYRRPIHELTEEEFHRTRGYIRNDRSYLVALLDSLRRFFINLLPLSISLPPKPPRRVWTGTIPTLEAFGQWANEGDQRRLQQIKRINLDVKIPEKEEAIKRFAIEVKRILERYGLDETVVFTAPNPAMMALLQQALDDLNFRARFTDVKEIIELLPDPTTIDLTPYQSVGLPRVGIDAADMYTELLAYWRLVHPEKKVGAWTLNTAGVLRKVMGLSVPWILTDNTPEAVGIQREIAQQYPGYSSA